MTFGLFAILVGVFTIVTSILRIRKFKYNRKLWRSTGVEYYVDFMYDETKQSLRWGIAKINKQFYNTFAYTMSYYIINSVILIFGIFILVLILLISLTDYGVWLSIKL